jgi:hypothetical protein
VKVKEALDEWWRCIIAFVAALALLVASVIWGNPEDEQRRDMID